MNFLSDHTIIGIALTGLFITLLIIILKSRFSSKFLDEQFVYSLSSNPHNFFYWKDTFFLVGIASSILLINIVLNWKSTQHIAVEHQIENLFPENDIIQTPPRTASSLPSIPKFKEIETQQAHEIPTHKIEPNIRPTFPSTNINPISQNQKPKISIPIPPPLPPAPTPKKSIKEIYKVVEEMPRFLNSECEQIDSISAKIKCAESAMLLFLNKNITYPEFAVSSGLEGTVIVNFVIDEKGNLIKPKILRSPNSVLSKEALRVVKNMPKWRPGQQKGRKVPVYFNLPIKFKLK